MIPGNNFPTLRKGITMKPISDEPQHVTQLASWKFFLYLALSVVLLTVMYYYQSMWDTNHFIQAYISDFQPVTKILSGDAKPAMVFVSMVAGGLALGSLIALFADLATLSICSIRGQSYQYWSESAVKHGSLTILSSVLFVFITL
jgi:hypothetical protein